MKCSILSSLLPLVMLSFSSLAAAKTFTYEAVIQADFDVVSSKRYISASVLVDGRDGLVDLSLQPVSRPCKPGFVCAAVMPEPLQYSLENTVSTIDRCRVISTVAKIDQRPVDGIFLKVELKDYRNNTCGRYDGKPALEMKVTEKSYNRLKGKKVSRVSKFAAQDVALIKPAPKPVPTSEVYQAVYRAELNTAASTSYSGGNLFGDGRNNLIELTLQPVMPACPEGMGCIQMMPIPMTYTFENSSSEIDDCGIIRTRASLDQRPADGALLEVIVNINRNNTCQTLAPLPAVEVILTESFYPMFGGQEIPERRSTFTADDMALINPAKN